MKHRVYAIVFFMTFIFTSMAQTLSIEYTYTDGTKEAENIGLDRMTITYKYDSISSYKITRILISNVFDPITPSGFNRIHPELWLYFKDGEASNIFGPKRSDCMYDFIQNEYNITLDKTNSNNTIGAFSFNCVSPRDIAFHNGKKIKSTSGRVSYSKFKNIPSNVLNNELLDNLKPFYLEPARTLTETSNGTCIKFISPSYNEYTKKFNINDLSLERIKVINNLKRLGYTLVSQKGEFPLLYRNDADNTVKIYETYIEIEF